MGFSFSLICSLCFRILLFSRFVSELIFCCFLGNMIDSLRRQIKEIIFFHFSCWNELNYEIHFYSLLLDHWYNFRLPQIIFLNLQCSFYKESHSFYCQLVKVFYLQINYEIPVVLNGSIPTFYLRNLNIFNFYFF